MTTMKKILSVAIATLLASSAFAESKNASKLDTLVVTPTPQMHCQKCENKIKTNIRFVKGIKSITTSVPNQTVTLVYDGTKSTYDDFVAAFRKIGYDIKKSEEKK